MKKLLTSIFIILISCAPLLYSSSFCFPVYASEQIEWEDLTDEDDLIDAFRAYCKSRKLFIDGSVPDSVTLFTTQSFNNICNTLGINVTALQAELKKRYDNGIYKYLFTVNGLNGFNRIFAEFLQNNDLSVGETVEDKTVYDGYYVSTDNGLSCNIFDISVSKQDSGFLDKSTIKTYGTFFYDTEFLINDIPLGQSKTYNFLIGINSYNYRINHFISNGGAWIDKIVLTPQQTDAYSSIYVENTSINGGITIAHYKNGAYGLCAIGFNSSWGNENLSKYTVLNVGITLSDKQSSNIYITTNNQTINNETVINEGDTYIIDSDGEPESDDPEPEPDPDPDPDDWDPSPWPTIPPNSGPPSTGNTIDWPDLDLPNFDLGNWNFSLGDLRNKFPFSIPFDIVSILSVLDTAPQAPVIQEDIPIRIDLVNVEYTLPIDLDMNTSTYNDFAVLVRSVEFIGFCLGLIHLTIRLVKG